MSAEIDLPKHQTHDEDYWIRLKLKYDPFSRGEEGDYYPILQWQHYFELLDHKISYSRGLIAVVGDTESGKSTLLQTFQAQYSDEYSISIINAHLRFDPEELLDVIKTTFEVEEDPQGFGDLHEKFHLTLERLAAHQSHPVLIIDNAHQLMDETLDLIVRLAQWQTESNHGLTFVLVGECELENYINKHLHRHQITQLLHTIKVEPLSIDATHQYIEQSLRRAGGLGKEFLTDEEMERIYKVSHGYIGRINQIAKEILSKAPVKTSRANRVGKINQTRLVGAATLILLAVAFSWALRKSGEPDPLTFQAEGKFKSAAPDFVEAKNEQANIQKNEMNETVLNSSKTHPVENQIKQTLPVIAENEVTKTIALPDQKIKLNNAMTHKEEKPVFQQEKLSPNNQDNALEQAEDVDEEEGVVQKEPNNKQDVAPITGTSSKSSTKSVKVIPDPSPKIKSNESERSPEIELHPHKQSVAIMSTFSKAPKETQNEKKIKTSERVVKTPKQYYAIQLLGTSSLSSLKQYAHAHHLDNKAYYLKETRGDKNWYVLYYGKYSSHQEAREDLAKLSGDVKKLNPWVRSCKNDKATVKLG